MGVGPFSQILQHRLLGFRHVVPPVVVAAVGEADGNRGEGFSRYVVESAEADRDEAAAHLGDVAGAVGADAAATAERPMDRFRVELVIGQAFGASG